MQSYYMILNSYNKFHTSTVAACQQPYVVMSKTEYMDIYIGTFMLECHELVQSRMPG